MPSTYTVNLGIEKIATGEQSGTWGDTTNTNLDLIDEAVNGVVVITLASAGTSGSPNTLAITNGTSSNGRNKYIEFTDGGDLGATAYVQLTPNDAEKVVHIRNNLSGSQSLIIFQGTYNASNDYEIPAGKDVVLKFDGGGAGAVVSQVFDDLYVESLTSVGDVGIGTNNPLVRLDIHDGVATTFTNNPTNVNLVNNGTIAAGLGTGINFAANRDDSSVTTYAAISGIRENDTSGSTLGALVFGTRRSSGLDLEAMRINSSGQVGINTDSPLALLHVAAGTPSAGGTVNSVADQFVITGSDGSNNGMTILGASNRTGNIFFADPDSEFSGYIQYAHATDSMQFGTSNVEVMRIDSSGNVGIGTSSPLGALHVQVASAGGGTISTSADEFVIERNSNTGITMLSPNSATQSLFFADPESQFAGYVQYTHTGDYLRFGTSASEAMRIDSSGRVMVSTTTQLTRSSNLLVYRDGSSTDPLSVYFPTTSTTQRVINAYSNVGGTANVIFIVRSDGDVQNATGTYTTISDERLKQDIVDANSQWDDIKALQVKNYRLKDRVAQSGDDAPTFIGVIAQDLESSGMTGLVKNYETEYWEEGDELPEGVSVGDVKEQAYKTVKYSILYMKAVKALQEAMERIETLESTQADLIARIEALEGN